MYVPLTYEEAIDSIGEDLAKLSKFIQPVRDIEQQVTEVVSDIRRSGFLLPIRGASGSGKSTFVASLAWSPHIPIRKVKVIESDSLDSSVRGGRLASLIARISEIVLDDCDRDEDPIAISSLSIRARLCIAIEYFESFDDYDEQELKSFFRDLNPILRKNKILLIWPIVNQEDLAKFIDTGLKYSTVLFHSRIKYIEFSGPNESDYIDIAKKTIDVFNGNKTYSSFSLESNDFQETQSKVAKVKKSQRTIRKYLEELVTLQKERSGYIEKLRNLQPKPIEVWFLVCYAKAEDVVAGFVRRSADDSAWDLDHSRLSPRVESNRKRAVWTRYPGRLAIAVGGAIKAKLLYIPTNVFMQCILSYGKDFGLSLSEDDFSKNNEDLKVPSYWWDNKYSAKEALGKSPLCSLINGDPSTSKRPSGTIPKALATASPLFEELIQKLTNKGDSSVSSDNAFNKILAHILNEIYQDTDVSFSPEIGHPWLPHIRPDILVKQNNLRDICLEFHYTARDNPATIADYCLSKLNSYMNQVEKHFESGQPMLFNLGEKQDN